MCMGKFFGEEKPAMKPEIDTFKILTTFVTSWTLKITQNGPKII